jgi:hypothetical protein
MSRATFLVTGMLTTGALNSILSKCVACLRQDDRLSYANSPVPSRPLADPSGPSSSRTLLDQRWQDMIW